MIWWMPEWFHLVALPQQSPAAVSFPLFAALRSVKHRRRRQNRALHTPRTSGFRDTLHIRWVLGTDGRLEARKLETRVRFRVSAVETDVVVFKRRHQRWASINTATSAFGNTYVNGTAYSMDRNIHLPITPGGLSSITHSVMFSLFHPYPSSLGSC